MAARISATELARTLGDVAPPLRDALRAWRSSRASDEGFADDLERVNSAVWPPRNPCGSARGSPRRR